jgi:uncharacterized integral membrane protein
MFRKEVHVRPASLFAFVVLVGIAILAIQNSAAPSVNMKFLLWDFQTSLVYTILGSLACGMMVVFFLWIPSAFKNSTQKKGLRKEIEIIERQMRHDIEERRKKPHQAPKNSTWPMNSFPASRRVDADYEREGN